MLRYYNDHLSKPAQRLAEVLGTRTHAQLYALYKHLHYAHLPGIGGG